MAQPLRSRCVLLREESNDLLQIAIRPRPQEDAVDHPLIFRRTSSTETTGSVSNERTPSSSAFSIAGVSSWTRELSQSANSRCSCAESLSIAASTSLTVLMFWTP